MHITHDCSAIIFVKYVKITFFQVLSTSLNELRKRKPGFDSKFLKIEKIYNKTYFSA